MVMVPKYSDTIKISVMEPSYDNTEIKNKWKDHFHTYGAIFAFQSSIGKVESSVDKIQNSDLVSADDEDEGNNLFRSIRGFLIFGKLIGVLPFSGVFTSSWKNLAFRKFSLTALVTYAITLILMLNSSLVIAESLRARKRTALDIANALRIAWYNVWGCLIYIYFIWKAPQFLNIFKVWNSIYLTFNKKDTTLRRDTYIIFGIIMISCILENAVLHMEYMKTFDKIAGKPANTDANRSFLEAYYWRAHGYWARLLGYNWFLAVLGFFQHKWTLYTVNFLDAILAVFGRALYFRFKSLYEQAEDKLLGGKYVGPESTNRGVSNDRDNWIKAVYDHQKLLVLVDVVKDFVSPLVFGSYALNTFYISLQLFDGLTDDAVQRSIIHSVYTPWSFIHLVLRMFIVSICCAQVNTYAHKFGEVLQKCPVDMYTTEVARVDKRVTAGPNIGLTGLECFTVTKEFILSILGVVFTYEIVLLNCDPGNATPTPQKKC